MGACVGPRGRHAEVVDMTGKDAAMLRAAALAAISLLTVLVVACGGGGGAADADPATAVPRDALAYVEVAVRPDGDVREDALAAAGKILRTPDPEAKIREVLDRALAEGDSGIDYDRDIAPWLGERAGLWVSNRIDEEGDPGVALAIASTDTDEAERSVDDGRAPQWDIWREMCCRVGQCGVRCSREAGPGWRGSSHSATPDRLNSRPETDT